MKNRVRALSVSIVPLLLKQCRGEKKVSISVLMKALHTLQGVALHSEKGLTHLTAIEYLHLIQHDPLH